MSHRKKLLISLLTTSWIVPVTALANEEWGKALASGLFILILPVLTPYLILWLWMLIDAIRHPIGNKILWVGILLLLSPPIVLLPVLDVPLSQLGFPSIFTFTLGPISLFLYYFIPHRKHKKEYSETRIQETHNALIHKSTISLVLGAITTLMYMALLLLYAIGNISFFYTMNSLFVFLFIYSLTVISITGIIMGYLELKSEKKKTTTGIVLNTFLLFISLLIFYIVY